MQLTIFDVINERIFKKIDFNHPLVSNYVQYQMKYHYAKFNKKVSEWYFDGQFLIHLTKRIFIDIKGSNGEEKKWIYSHTILKIDGEGKWFCFVEETERMDAVKALSKEIHSFIEKHNLPESPGELKWSEEQFQKWRKFFQEREERFELERKKRLIELEKKEEIAG
jgi:hypothetical protein